MDCSRVCQRGSFDTRMKPIIEIAKISLNILFTVIKHKTRGVDLLECPTDKKTPGVQNLAGKATILSSDTTFRVACVRA